MAVGCTVFEVWVHRYPCHDSPRYSSLSVDICELNQDNEPIFVGAVTLAYTRPNVFLPFWYIEGNIPAHCVDEAVVKIARYLELSDWNWIRFR